MIKDFIINLSENICLNIMSTLLFIACLTGVWIAYTGQQTSIFIIGIVLLLRLPLPIQVTEDGQ
jgi:hypothetical protein